MTFEYLKFEIYLFNKRNDVSWKKYICNYMYII